MNEKEELKKENSNLRQALENVQPYVISIENKKLLQQLKTPDENINDVVIRVIKAFIMPYDPTSGHHHTPYHLNYKKSLAYELHSRGANSIEQAKPKPTVAEKKYFNTLKGYNLWVKKLEDIPPILRGKIE